jgi:glycosyltransferase involved in cell wall biosynthesis
VNLTNYKSYEGKIMAKISEINPSIIRSFNPRIQGWLATKIGNKLNVPVIISLHTNYLQQTNLEKKQGNYFKFLKLKYLAKKLEKFSLNNSDAVICVYEFIVPYAKQMNARNIEVIYNKIDLKKFSTEITKKFVSKKPVIISVGRLIEQKNRIPLIKSIKELDVELLIIGDGPELENINNTIEHNNLKSKVKIIKKIPNEELAQYYRSADIFALPLENLDGIPIPFLESMACGLPVITTKHSDSFSEITDEAVVFVENDPQEFSKTFQKIISDSEYKEKLISKSLKIAKLIGGDSMESKELELYQKYIK